MCVQRLAPRDPLLPSLIPLLLEILPGRLTLRLGEVRHAALGEEGVELRLRLGIGGGERGRGARLMLGKPCRGGREAYPTRLRGGQIDVVPLRMMRRFQARPRGETGEREAEHDGRDANDQVPTALRRGEVAHDGALRPRVEAGGRG